LHRTNNIEQEKEEQHQEQQIDFGIENALLIKRFLSKTLQTNK
jgi:hypothetical protein